MIPPGRWAAALGSNRNGGPKHFKALPYAEVAGALRKIEASGALRLHRPSDPVPSADRNPKRRGQVGQVGGDRHGRPGLDHSRRADQDRQGPQGAAQSTAALGALAAVWPRQNLSGLIFPNRTARPLSDNDFLSKLFRELEIPAVPHGFRSAASAIGARKPEFAGRLRRLALAHTLPAVEAAYNQNGPTWRPGGRLWSGWGLYLTAEPIS